MTGLRWSQQQLDAHLKAHRDRANLSKLRVKEQNQAKVQQANKSAVSVNSERFTPCIENQVLSCEIATTPPSVNHYWERSGKGMRLSDKARQFHAVVIALIPALRLTSRLKMEVTFHFPTHQKRDIDNHLKATIDSLVKCGFCEDDEQFDELHVKRGNVIKGGLIKLKVWEI
ncbi:RusA family crossover junction endodeoxyribonuclease [Acinetobacter sp. FL51]|nr:RusA family crossover junction endodeoxyribonuclease [Acinetobacter sp. FL51]